VDPSPTPWRVLEDPADAAPATAAGHVEGPSRFLPIPRSTVLIGGLAAALAIGAFALAFGTGSSGTIAIEGGAALDSQRPAASPSSGSLGSGVGTKVLVVEIVGAVDRPGVFRMPATARIGDLVAAAGGYGPRVDTQAAGRELNLAAPLHDGDQIRVPSRDDATGPHAVASGGGPGPTGAVPATRPIDLNRATAAELDKLPGIRPATAAKILAARDQQPFVAVEDLRTRKLVGEKTFEKLKDLVTVP
jgi:competence protein ComEA